MEPIKFSTDELEIIKDFQHKFFQISGYIPLVLPQEYREIHIKKHVISLEDLHEVFEKYRVNKLGKKISLKGRARHREIVDLRIIFAYLASELGYTLNQIGRALGNRHHSSILHYIRTFYNIIETCEPFQKLYNNIITDLKSKHYKDDELSTVVYFNKIQHQSKSAVLS